MKVLAGDIGNTVTKICLLESKNLRIKMVGVAKLNMHSIRVPNCPFNPNFSYTHLQGMGLWKPILRASGWCSRCLFRLINMQK